MTIYIVTVKTSHDYYIKKVFSSKVKAKEYVEWLDVESSIEEYETDDNLKFDKCYKIIISLKIYDNKEDLTCNVYKTNKIGKNETYFSDYHDYSPSHLGLYLVRFVQSQNFSNESTNLYVKEAYNLMDIIKQKSSEYYTEKQINEIINNKILNGEKQ